MLRSGRRRTLFALFLSSIAAQAVASQSGVVISQVYGGNGGTYNQDFVELFNAGTAAVSIAGWSVQYASATGTGLFSGNGVTVLSGILQPGQYYLVALSSGGGGAALPAADATGSPNLSSSSGKVVLVNIGTGLACNGGSTPCSPSQIASIVDLVGYGSANFFEGSATAPTLSTTTAAFRGSNGCVDTDRNSADFTAGTPSPRNRATPLSTCAANHPIVATCTAFNTVQAIAGSSAISATDSDGIVNGASITGGAVTGITLGTLTPASANGGVASVRVQVDASVPVGAHAPVVTFTNDQAQSASCTVSISVLAPPASLTPIYSIQGSGATSPLVGQQVTTRGIVTAVFSGLLGYYIQDETGDANPATSDGIFVFANSQSLPVAVGERVQVTGNVSEYAGFAGNPTVTEITGASNLAKLGLGSIAPTPIVLPEAAEGDLERYEGMLVTITSTLTVSQNYFQGRYGQVTLSANGRLTKPTNAYRPGTAQALALADENARRRIVLDDGASSESLFNGVENPNPISYIGADNTLRAGDTVANLTGIIDFGRITSATGADAIVDYKLQPTVPPVFARVNSRTPTPPAVGGTLKVASFNVLNYFTTFSDGNTAGGQSGQGCLPSGTTADCRGADNLAEFNRQRDKIIRAIAGLDGDVVGLMELQRNSGVAAQNLAAGLNAYLGSNVYAVVPDPGNVGTDAIQVAMIYKPALLSLVGAALSDADPIHNRPPLAQTFQAVSGGESLTVIVNHFKSKGCDGATGADLDQGDGQGCYNDRRKQQANALLSFIGSVQAAAGDTDVLVIGDLNAYAKEDPVDILVNGGLADQLLRFAGASEYSYVFDGEAGYIDHALATPSLAAQVTDTAHWHINADEPSVIDYNTDFKPQDLYTVSPYRASDHDPVLVGLRLGPPLQSQTIALGALQDRHLGSGTFGLSASASSGLTVAFSSLTTATCTVSGTTVTLVAVGLCTIAADQAGNAIFASAPQVQQSFNALPALQTQTITFGALGDKVLGAPPFAISASASSGLPVSFVSLTPGVCTMSGDTVTLVAAGACTIQADQAGDGTYAPAAPVQQSFNVSSGGGGGSPSAEVPIPLWALLGLAFALGALGTRRVRA